MGGAFSSSVYDGSRDCVVLDERMSYIFVRLYSLFSNLSEKLETVIIGNTISADLKVNPQKYLVDTGSINPIMKELADSFPEIFELSHPNSGKTFLDEKDVLVSVSNGYTSSKKQTFLDRYNETIIRLSQNASTGVEDLKNIKNSIDERSDILLLYLNKLCTTDIGVA